MNERVAVAAADRPLRYAAEASKHLCRDVAATLGGGDGAVGAKLRRHRYDSARWLANHRRSVHSAALLPRRVLVGANQIQIRPPHGLPSAGVSDSPAAQCADMVVGTRIGREQPRVGPTAGAVLLESIGLQHLFCRIVGFVFRRALRWDHGPVVLSGIAVGTGTVGMAFLGGPTAPPPKGRPVSALRLRPPRHA